jgi:replicative superfamily II helicase
MKIGFPVIVGESQEIVVFWLSANPLNNPGITIKNPHQGDSISITVSSFPSIYQRLVSDLVQSGLQVTLELDGSIGARSALFQNGQLHFSGDSGTLAFFVLNQLHSVLANTDDEARALISGRLCLKNGGQPQVFPLGPGFRNHTQKKAKYADSRGIHLWLHTADITADITDENRMLIRFDVYNDSPAWFLNSFRKKYGLDININDNTIADAEPNTPQKFTERDLFRRAIDPVAFEDLDRRLDEYFDPTHRPARVLLPIQNDALSEEHSPKVFAPLSEGTTELRHLLIIGPTGCGKTTLLHSLFLNGLHNRRGSVLYLGPTRALVEEVYETVTQELKLLLPSQSRSKVILSTGDYSKDDALIASGHFGLACMVNEKANVLFSADDADKLAKHLSIVIVDELHMLTDPSRGGLLDLLITSFSRSARTRFENGELPLQLVGVTTEALSEQLLKTDTFWLDPDDRLTMPCVLQATKRPVAVSHSVAIIYEKYPLQAPYWAFKKFINFEFDLDRAQSDDDLCKLLPRFNARGDEIKHYENREIGDGMRRFDNQLLELVLSKRQGHRTLIVSVKSVDKTENFANGLSNRIGDDVSVEPVSTEFLTALRVSGLSHSRLTDMETWANAGIYVHNGQLPRRLRNTVAQVFRQKLDDNSRRKILITTETLTYGVNLSASCIILTTLEMSRDDPADPFAIPIDRPLDRNKYHNLLGRAGRLGFETGDPVEAIVCIGLSEFSKPAQRLGFLRDYYGKEPPSRLLSAIALPSDLSVIRRNKETQEFVEKQPFNLERCSFPLLRTVLDASRKTGNSKSAEDIITFVRDTIGYQSASDHDRQKIETLCRLTLERAAEFNEGEIKVLDDIGGYYTLLPAGAALIDTGTSLHSVSPVASWMLLLHKRGLTQTRVEVLIPGFLCAPDFTKIAGELIPEARYADQFSNEELDKLTEDAIADLGQEWNLIDASTQKALKEAMMEFMDSPRLATVFREQSNRFLARISIIKLFSITLKWLRGSSNEEMLVVAKRNMEERQRKEWGSKYAERLESLCRMCYRFFQNARGYLTEEQSRQLPKLALRLKHGLPFDALPYLNALSMEGVLPREAVVKLYNAVPCPFELLRDDPDFDRRVKSVLDDIPEANVKNVREVKMIVRKAYQNGLQSFLDTINQGDAASFVERAKEALTTTGVDQQFALDWNPMRLLKCPLSERTDRNLRVIPKSGALAIEQRYGMAQINFTVDDPHPRPNTIRLVGWHSAHSNAYWTATPCGYTLLVSLLLRELVDIELLHDLMARNDHAQIDVTWVSDHLLGGEDISNLRNFREFLLAFVEPTPRQPGTGATGRHQP